MPGRNPILETGSVRNKRDVCCLHLTASHAHTPCRKSRRLAGSRAAGIVDVCTAVGWDIVSQCFAGEKIRTGTKRNRSVFSRLLPQVRSTVCTEGYFEG